MPWPTLPNLVQNSSQHGMENQHFFKMSLNVNMWLHTVILCITDIRSEQFPNITGCCSLFCFLVVAFHEKMIQVSTMHVAVAVKNVIFSQHLLVIQNCSYYYLLRINQMECLFNWLTVSELGVFIYLLCMYTILVLEVKVIFAFVKQLNGFAVRICSIQIPYWMKMISRSRIHCL